MKADPSVQAALLDLQAVDTTLAQLDHKQQHLPEHATIADLETRMAALNDDRVRTETQVSDLERALAKAEGEVELVRTRRARNEERLNSGAITNPKDLQGLQHEIVALDRRIATLEDEELEVMESFETAQAQAEKTRTELADLTEQHRGVAEERDGQIADFDAQRGDLRAERAQLAGGVPDDLLTLYEKLRAQHGGLGAAALERRRCQGCHLELTGSDLRDVAAMPADAIVRCPECSRILVRTPESGL